MVYRVKAWSFGSFSCVSGQFGLPAPFGTGHKVLGPSNGSDYWYIRVWQVVDRLPISHYKTNPSLGREDVVSSTS